MNWQNGRRIMLTAVEIYSLHLSGSTSGLSRKLAELEQHIKQGGVLAPGVLFPDCTRRGGMDWLNWAIDLKGCLPEGMAGRVLCWYYGVDPSFATTYDREMPCRLHRWGKRLARRYWRLANDRGLVRDGEFIAGRIG